MGPVFISYSSRDRDRVSELAAALARQGFDVWWDTHLPPGEDWDERIQRALEASEVILVVWTEASMQSREVRAEATYGLQESKLLPIRIEDVRLWARYNIVQYKDVFSRPPEDDPNWHVVVGYLRRYAGSPERDGAPEDVAPLPAPAGAAVIPAPAARPARGGAVIPRAMVLPSAFTGAGGLTFLSWLIAGAEGLGGQVQFYSAVGLLAIGLAASALSMIRTPRTA